MQKQSTLSLSLFDSKKRASPLMGIASIEDVSVLEFVPQNIQNKLRKESNIKALTSKLGAKGNFMDLNLFFNRCPAPTMTVPVMSVEENDPPIGMPAAAAATVSTVSNVPVLLKPRSCDAEKRRYDALKLPLVTPSRLPSPEWDGPGADIITSDFVLIAGFINVFGKFLSLSRTDPSAEDILPLVSVRWLSRVLKGDDMQCRMDVEVLHLSLLRVLFDVGPVKSQGRLQEQELSEVIHSGDTDEESEDFDCSGTEGVEHDSSSVTVATWSEMLRVVLTVHSLQSPFADESKGQQLCQFMAEELLTKHYWNIQDRSVATSAWSTVRLRAAVLRRLVDLVSWSSFCRNKLEDTMTSLGTAKAQLRDATIEKANFFNSLSNTVTNEGEEEEYQQSLERSVCGGLVSRRAADRLLSAREENKLKAAKLREKQESAVLKALETAKERVKVEEEALLLLRQSCVGSDRDGRSYWDPTRMSLLATASAANDGLVYIDCDDAFTAGVQHELRWRELDCRSDMYRELMAEVHSVVDDVRDALARVGASLLPQTRSFNHWNIEFCCSNEDKKNLEMEKTVDCMDSRDTVAARMELLSLHHKLSERAMFVTKFESERWKSKLQESKLCIKLLHDSLIQLARAIRGEYLDVTWDGKTIADGQVVNEQCLLGFEANWYEDMESTCKTASQISIKLLELEAHVRFDDVDYPECKHCSRDLSVAVAKRCYHCLFFYHRHCSVDLKRKLQAKWRGHARAASADWILCDNSREETWLCPMCLIKSFDIDKSIEEEDEDEHDDDGSDDSRLSVSSSGRESGDDGHDDNCEHCGGGGELLLCDHPGCARSSHIECAGLRRVPRSSWFCSKCSKKPQNKSSSAPSSRSARKGRTDTSRPVSSRSSSRNSVKDVKLEVRPRRTVSLSLHAGVDVCAKCHGLNPIAKCMECKQWFHRLCVDPPIMSIHDGWHCKACNDGVALSSSSDDLPKLKRHKKDN